MNTFIQLSSVERNLYCRQAAERMETPLPAAVIEKDFWVCWTLNLLNEIPELKGNITFKGGTSLSKAWGLIERFSEDIDIAINRKVFGQQPPHGAEDATSNTQRKTRLVELEDKSASFIMEILLPILQEKIAEHLNPAEFTLKPIQKGNEINIEFEYPGTLKNELGGLLPVVLIELVPRADEIPNEERKSRHYYDLLKLYNAGVFERIKNNRELLQMVVEHRQTFFRYNTLDYAGISSNGVRVVPSKDSWTDWRGDYTRTAVMIYKDIPSFEELISFAEQLENEFNKWVKKS